MNKIMKKNLSKNPKVSIVLPVFNAGIYLKDCLESLLNQTYKDFELIIVDDCSTDNSYQILKQYSLKYRKIRLFRNNKNKGVSETVKKAISFSRGDYLARMDADDISLPTRIEKQLNYLENNPGTVAVGGQCFMIDASNKIIGKKIFPTSFEAIYKYIFRFIPIQQPTLMIAKKRLPERFKYYQDGMNTAEEVELFFKLFNYGRVENIDEFVLMYRIHDKNTSLINVKETFLLTLLARIEAVFKYNYKPDPIGIIYTVIQALVVLLLPQKIIIFLYKLIRNASVLSVRSFFKDYSLILPSFARQK